MKKLNVVFCSFPDFAGNSRSLYDYMSKKYNDKMNLYWVIRDEKLYQKLKEKNIKVVKDETKEMYDLMDNIDVFFTTHANLTDYKKQNSKALYIELWHGVSPKCVGYLINNMSESDELWMKKMTRKIDYFVVPSKFWVPIFSARFNVLPERVLPLGFPLFDNILKANGKKNLEKVLKIDTSSYKKIIYYMPTVRSGANRDENVVINVTNAFNIKKYSEKQLKDYLEKNNYLLCIKHHPSEKIKFNHIECKNIKYITEDIMRKYKIDTNMILNAADLLITDYSSLGLHYLMLEKPVIYLKRDLKEFTDTRGILFDNFEFWTGDNIATDIDTLINKIDENLTNPDLDSIKKKKILLFGDKKDGGCKDICNYIFNEDGGLKVQSFINEEERLLEENNKLKHQSEEYFLELQSIKYSRSYRFIQKIKKIINYKKRG